MTTTHTDRELLELAAKAAGWLNTEYQDMRGWGEVRYGLSKAIWVPELDAYWNPLVDDGDALRLAAKLKIDIEWQATSPFPEPRVEAYQRNDEGSYFCSDEHEDNYRRAIVRAAAEIGRTMP